MEKKSGVTYATHDGVALLGDLYIPDGSGPFPALVAVHGGGWQQGTRVAYRHWGPHLAKAGYVVFAVDYRLCKPQQKSYPQAVHDIRAAVQFVRFSATDLKVDGKRIGLTGNSAGAHLAALVALAGDQPVFAGAYPLDPFAALSTKVKAMVGLLRRLRSGRAMAARSGRPAAQFDLREIPRGRADRRPAELFRGLAAELCHARQQPDRLPARLWDARRHRRCRHAIGRVLDRAEAGRLFRPQLRRAGRPAFLGVRAFG